MVTPSPSVIAAGEEYLQAASTAALAQPATVQAAEVEQLRAALATAKQAARYVASGDGAYDPYASHIEAVDAIVDAALATQPAPGRTMGGAS